MPPTPLQTSKDRRLRQREEARQAILDATEALLIDEGYESFSMRKLAARCGYAAPTIYHYFGDKPGLLDTLIELRVKELSAEMRAVRLGSDPVENMRGLFLAFARWGLANPTHYELLTSTREPHPAGEEAREILMRPVTELAEQGRLEVEIELARQSFWALVHGIISLHTMRPEKDWSEQLTDRSLDAMIRGLVKPEPS